MIDFHLLISPGLSPEGFKKTPLYGHFKFKPQYWQNDFATEV